MVISSCVQRATFSRCQDDIVGKKDPVNSKRLRLPLRWPPSSHGYDASVGCTIRRIIDLPLIPVPLDTLKADEGEKVQGHFPQNPKR